MRAQDLLLLAFALGTVSAAPTEIQKRGGDLIVNDKGDITITFSDDKVKLGTVKIQDIIEGIAKRCSEQGKCDSSSQSHKGMLVSNGADGEYGPVTVSVAASGTYPTWVHNGLVEVLSKAVLAVADCKDVEYAPNCSGAISHCSAEPVKANVCTVPRYWGVKYGPSDLGNAAPPGMNANLTSDTAGSGFCSNLYVIANAVMGVVEGAGGIFKLNRVSCLN